MNNSKASHTITDGFMTPIGNKRPALITKENVPEGYGEGGLMVKNQQPPRMMSPMYVSPSQKGDKRLNNISR